WAIFEQPVSWKPEPAKVGEIIREASLFEETFALNPAVTLVTLGVSLDWQLPPDSDLYSRAIATGDRLHSLWFEWTDSENETLRANHSNIANAATYALYAFLGYDEEKLTLWRNAYSSLFGEDPSQPPKTVFFQQVQATSLTPFLARPFVHPAESFYTVNSFFDHQYPRYANEGEAHSDSLYRFDGQQFNNAAFAPCILQVSCYSGHDGYDYNTPLGEPILAASGGKVTDISQRTGTVVISHDNGLLTIYRHLDTIDVKKGVQVAQGDQIGTAGSRATGGVHLHFELQYPDNVEKNIDPFGWWSADPDPWSEYPNIGQVSAWLWKGDEAGDGYLTVDNRETQAQLFLSPAATPPEPPSIGWHRLDTGYQNESWYTFMHTNVTTYTYWALWGTYLDQPGEYIVQAYWPSDPNPDDEWQPASNARYTLHFYESGNLRTETLYGNQTLNANEFTPLCKVPYQQSGCPEEQIARFRFEQGASVLILTNQATYDSSQHQRMLFFDAVRWAPAPPPTPTPTSTPTSTPTPTATPTLPPAPGARGFYPNGITASYYNDQDDGRWYIGGPITWQTFTNFVVSRLESFIAFNTGTSSPATGVNGTFWSARWTGQLAVPQSGNYVFYFDDLDDGARLYLDGNLLLESWLVQGAHDYQSGPIFLNAGLHDIVVEYAQGPAVGGSFYLSWSSPFFTKELIGPAGGQSPTPTPTPTASCPCIFTCGPSARSLTLSSGVETTPTPSALRALSQAVDLVELLYRLRDEVLAQTSEGQHYITTYYAHSPEIATILLSDSALYEQGFAVLDSFVPALQALVDGEGEEVVITAQQVEAVRDFLNRLMAQSSPALAETIRTEQARRPLERIIGMNAAEAWAYLNGYHLTWRPPLNTADPYLAQSGRTIPVEFSLADFQSNFVVDESVTLQLLDDAGKLIIGPIGLGNTPVEGIVVQGKKYHYDLQTTDLKPGLYTLQVVYNAVVPGEPAVWTIQIKAK
ncbi:MAG: hypothetical protein DDG60_15140, partial [Anaerolineae bacterium]